MTGAAGSPLVPVQPLPSLGYTDNLCQLDAEYRTAFSYTATAHRPVKDSGDFLRSCSIQKPGGPVNDDETGAGQRRFLRLDDRCFDLALSLTGQPC